MPGTSISARAAATAKPAPEPMPAAMQSNICLSHYACDHTKQAGAVWPDSRTSPAHCYHASCTAHCSAACTLRTALLPSPGRGAAALREAVPCIRAHQRCCITGHAALQPRPCRCVAGAP
jgi:hypothetical protein